MTTTPAGWYPDPAGSGGQRWWDGSTWGEQVQPAPQPVAQPAQQWGAGASAQQPQWGTGAAPQWGPQPPAAPQSFAKRNGISIAIFVIAVIYVALAATVHLFFIGVLPVILSIQAIKAKEPLAWPAVGVAAAILIFAITQIS